jgi:mRNA interferase MazF
MTIQAGEFWLANIVFTDGSGWKRRPVLALWVDGLYAVVAAVTSVAPRSATDVKLSNWRSAGLRVPSTVRLSRLDCLEQSLFFVRLGVISEEDAQRMLTVWRSDVQPQF